MFVSHYTPSRKYSACGDSITCPRALLLDCFASNIIEASAPAGERVRRPRVASTHGYFFFLLTFLALSFFGHPVTVILVVCVTTAPF